MISLRGPKLKIFAAVLAVIALAAGVYLTFFRSQGFVKTTGTIVSLREDSSDDSSVYYPTVEYSVDGKTYTGELDTGSGSYKVGKTIPVLYDPNDPVVVHDGSGVGIYFIAVGAVILLMIVFLTVKQKTSVNKLKERQGEIQYLPSEKGEERELYFITDLGTPKFGHRIEDKDRRVLYEAKMTKFTLLSAYVFDFIDHEKNQTTHHLIGHTEEMDWNSILIDNHNTFTLDGMDVWKHLRSIGVTIDARFGKAEGIMPSYDIRKDGEHLAYAENTSHFVHEEDAEQHKVASKIPNPMFFRVFTDEKNLDLLFMILVAIARSGATDERGGSRRMLLNTVKGE
ncbi:MAG: DUF3592 domain-containing protein [Oscillospiraceae bacterium]|nr:DUF3592 domain-containing protein [Oscillospiraceae bacterium]